MANFELWLTALYSLGLQKEKPNASHFYVSLFQATVPTTVILCHVYTCRSFSLRWLVTRFILVPCLHNVLLRRWRGTLHFCEGQAFSLYGTHSRRFSPDLSCCGSIGRGLVAARSGCTCHLASSWPNKTLRLCRTTPSARNLAGLVTLTWPEGGLMYTAWQCSLSAVFELQATVPEAIQELQTLMFRDREITAQIQHLFYFHTFFFPPNTSHIHHINRTTLKVSLFWPPTPKKVGAERDTT